MRFKLRHMEVFRAIMLTGSASGAARMLFISQPVVSRTLAHIESTLGLSLFDRKGGALSPTENARIIFREVDDLYGAASRIDGLIANLKTARRKHIAFLSSPALGISVVPRAIKHYLSKHSDATFAYRTGLIRDMPMELLGKVIDFALSIWPIDHPNLRCERLFGGKICLIVPRGHALARFDVVPVVLLREVPLILYQQDMPIGALIRESLVDAGINAVPVVEINRSEQACSLVHQGLGVALVNRYCVDEDIWSNVVVKNVDLDIPASVYLISSRFEPLSDDAQGFITGLRAQYETDMSCDEKGG